MYRKSTYSGADFEALWINQNILALKNAAEKVLIILFDSRFTAWDTHCSNQIDLNCPIKAGECWAMGVISCRKNCDAKFLLRGTCSQVHVKPNTLCASGNRGKFKRCIYKEMKDYEKDNVGIVSEQCSVFHNSLQ